MTTTALAQGNRRLGVDALVTKYRGILFDAAGLIQFGPMLFLLLTQAPKRSASEWIAGLGCFAFWLVARLLLPASLRFPGMTCAGLLLLASPLLISNVAAPAFIPITTISYAIVLAGIIAYRARWSVLIIVIATGLLGLLGVYRPAAAMLPGGALDIQLSMLLCIIAGAGILITKVEFVRLWRRSDARTRRAFRRAARAQRSRQRVLARTAAERAIHETVLNTLTAISMGVGTDRPGEIREACAIDLQKLDEIPGPLPQPTASSAVEAALDRAATIGLRCQVIGESTHELDTFTAWALRDSVAEALLNVSRHSGVMRANIEITEHRGTTVIVRDEGRGLKASRHESFGLSRSIRQSLLDVGGEARIQSEPTSGTTVILSVPHRRVQEPLSAEPRRLDSTASLAARLGLLGTLLVLALGAPLISGGLGVDYQLTIVAIGSLLVGIGLSLLWNTMWRIPLAISSVALIALMYWLAASSAPQCSSVPAYAWLIALAGGGGALPAMIAPSSPAHRMLVIFSVTIIGTLSLIAVPGECRATALLPLVTNTIYLASVWLVMRWGDRTLLVERETANVAQLVALERELETERSVAALEGWSKVDPATREFIRSVASGAVDLTSDAAQSFAANLATEIRRRISLIGHSTSPQSLIGSLTELGRVAGVRIELAHLSEIEYDAPVPENLTQNLGEALKSLACTEVAVHIVESGGNQTIVARFEISTVGTAADLPHPELTQGFEISFFREPEDPSIGCLLIERPLPFQS